MRLNAVDILAFVLVIVGGLNWGLVGAFDYNLVDAIFGSGSGISKVIYVLVGVAALYVGYVVIKMSSKAK